MVTISLHWVIFKLTIDKYMVVYCCKLCRGARIFVYVISVVCVQWCPTHIVVLYFVCLRLVSCVPYVARFSGLSILDWPFSILYVYLFCLSSSCVLCTLCCPFLWVVHSWLIFRFSLDCPFLIDLSVFSGLSILDWSFGFL